MSEFAEISIGDLFTPTNGRAKYTLDYIRSHPGEHPVYSAALSRPFGFISEYDYCGDHLIWVMNGYGGRVSEVSGRFSVNRDCGVLIPKAGQSIPNLTFMRFALEPQLVSAAVGRRVDGRQNEYTKIYPPTVEDLTIRLPLDSGGRLDYPRMEALGAKYLRIEAAQRTLQNAYDNLQSASIAFQVPEPNVAISLGDCSSFSLSIGKRVVRKELLDHGVLTYSSNVHVPLGMIAESNLCDFRAASLIWGIDGNFDWNLIPAGQPFATTDHCGRLQIQNRNLDIEYAYAYLKSTRERYAFDRVYRASLGNVMEEVSVVVPLDDSGEPSIDMQRRLASDYWTRAEARARAVTTIQETLSARLDLEM